MEYTIEQVAERLRDATLQEAFVSGALRQVQRERELSGRGEAPWSEEDLEDAFSELAFMTDQEVEERLMRD